MLPLHEITEKFYGRPLLLHPQSAFTVHSVLLNAVRTKAGIEGGSVGERPVEIVAISPAVEKADGTLITRSPQSSRFAGEFLTNDETGTIAPYPIANGVAIITIIGKLVNRGAWLGSSSGMVSYEGLKYKLALATRDTKVKSILLDIQSPGGEAIGCFDMAAAVRRANAVKPVVALVNGVCASAAYSLASGARNIVCIPDGIAGSIGVVLLHLDLSLALQMEGVKPTFIFAGAHKVDGNPYEPLPKDVRDDLRAEVERYYEMFVSTVADGRGKKLVADAIRATEARCYIGADALSAGLVDAIGDFDDLMAEMASETFGTSVAMPSPDDDEDGEPEAKNKGGAKATVQTEDQSPTQPSATAPQGEEMKLSENGKKFLQALMLINKDEAEAAGVTPPANETPVPPQALPVGLAPKSAPPPKHYRIDASATGPLSCGEASAENTTTDLNDTTCDSCLRAEIARRDLAASQLREKEKAEAEKARIASIEPQADAILKKYELKGGKAWAEIAKAEITEALTIGGDAGTARLERFEKMAAAMPDVGQVARHALPEQSEGSAFATDQEIAKEAMARCAKEGLKPGDPKFSAAYTKHLAEIAAMPKVTNAA